MNKFKYYFILLTVTVIIFSCTKKDNPVVPVEPPRDYAVQYATDIADIEQYLKTNYITVVNHPGFNDDQDVTITKIDAGQTSIWDQTTYQLKNRDVVVNKVTHKLYYLVLRPGTGDSPCNVDGVLAAYRGDYLARTTATDIATLTATFFQENKYPSSFLDLFGTVRGWKEIFPQFKTGTHTLNANGTVTYNDFGAGVIFIPSGLGYFNTPPDSSIVAYAPLVFSFKLYELKRLDHEYEIRSGQVIATPDGILSYQEDINGDGYIWTKNELPDGAINPDDTDSDGTPDFLDTDDDGDGYTTKFEINNPATGLPFPFADIPTCTSGKKNYLVNTCHP